MADVYVRSGASGAGTGADWANAYTTLAAALTGSASAGNDYWVSEDHSETTAGALTFTSPGTLASPCQIICVNHTGSVPPVAADIATTANVITTGNSAMTFTGCAYIYGITFQMGTGANSPAMALGGTTHTNLLFDACAIQLLSTTGPSITIGSSTASVSTNIVWNNTTYKVGTANAVINLINGTPFTWKNTASAIQGATLPTNLFGAGSSVSAGTVVVDGVDLSALSSKTLVAAMPKFGRFWFKDCKFPATVTVAATQTSASAEIFVMRSASGGTAYTLEKHNCKGDQTTETTIVRTGGAQINGTSVAMKIVGTGNAKFQAPFESSPLVVTNTTTSSNVTLTVYGIWAGGAVPNNDEVWMEIGYLGSSSSPLLTFDNSTRKATPLTTAAGQSSDTSTWGGSTTKFKLTATLSSPQPLLAGEMYVTIKVASTNATYIDPVVYLS